MKLEEAELVYTKIKSSELTDLVNNLVMIGVRYARIRVDWYLSSTQERNEMDDERTIAHDAFISSCDILARNMANHGEDSSWRNILGKNRKDIGDFACWLHLIIGIKAR